MTHIWYHTIYTRFSTQLNLATLASHYMRNMCISIRRSRRWSLTQQVHIWVTINCAPWVIQSAQCLSTAPTRRASARVMPLNGFSIQYIWTVTGNLWYLTLSVSAHFTCWIKYTYKYRFNSLVNSNEEDLRRATLPGFRNNRFALKLFAGNTNTYISNYTSTAGFYSRIS